MAEFKIVHREELVGEFYLEADSEEDAIQKFNFMVDNGEIDFSDMEMVDSSDTPKRIERVKVPVTKISGGD